MVSLDVVMVLQYYLCAESGWLPRLVRRKVSILCAFTVGFFKGYKSCFLLLVAFPGLILFTVASLNVLFMIIFDADPEIFPQHTITNLNSGIIFYYLFSQEKSLRWKAHAHQKFLWLLNFFQISCLVEHCCFCCKDCDFEISSKVIPIILRNLAAPKYPS